MQRTSLLSLAVIVALSLSACQAMSDTLTSVNNAVSGDDSSDQGAIEIQNNASAPNAAAIAKNSDEDCPQVSVDAHHGDMHQFMRQDKMLDAEKVSDVAITSIQHHCSFKDHNLIVSLGIRFKGTLGPKAKAWSNEKPSFAYPYYVAIDKDNGEELAREIFAATISYDKGQDSAEKTENIRQIIPISTFGSAKDYKVRVGFQLTPQEELYNMKALSAASNTAAADADKTSETVTATETISN